MIIIISLANIRPIQVWTRLKFDPISSRSFQPKFRISPQKGQPNTSSQMGICLDRAWASPTAPFKSTPKILWNSKLWISNTWRLITLISKKIWSFKDRYKLRKGRNLLSWKAQGFHQTLSPICSSTMLSIAISTHQAHNRWGISVIKENL